MSHIGLFFIVAFLLGSRVEAKVYGLFDFDGTIVRDRGEQATWITPWLLKRVEQLHSTAQRAPNKPLEILLTDTRHIAYYNARAGESHPLDQPLKVSLQMPEQLGVSYDEFIRLEPFLARGESILGGLRPVLLNPDPLFPERNLLIVPGYYRLFDSTFKYYREAASFRHKNYLRENFIQARARQKLSDPDKTWKGEAFELFAAFMAHPSTVGNAQIFTSRGHQPREYKELWEEMARAGEIKNARTVDGRYLTAHSLSQPEARIFGRALAERKVQVVKNVMSSLFYSSGERHEIQNSRGKAQVHTLLIAEDEPSYVDTIAQYLLDVSGGYYADRVEIVLLNTGTDEEIAKARFPFRWTRFEPGRRAMAATPEQIANWLDPEFHLYAAGCESSLVTTP